MGENLPVFGQITDGIHFRNTADSLELVYPDSKYVKALRQEADRRMGYLELQNRIDVATQITFPEIELPDLQAVKRKLSEVDSKAVMLYFWTAADASQNMFNLDVLKPLYDEFNKKGFEIYQVSLDVDKGLWARVVKEQALPWINVCDMRGSASPYASMYNVTSLPAMYIIHDGEIKGGKIEDIKTLRKMLRDILK
jgi:peroxiredoxin